mmetsp:Transcript_9318/g.14400  ORF Transcript_9318/g.14400 Transcript_9318/m.14400 type:complete len:129 (+) Transcript_9318:62-448(+)
MSSSKISFTKITTESNNRIPDISDEVDVQAVLLDCPAAVNGDGVFGRTPMVLSSCPKCKMSHARTKTITRPSVVTWGLVVVGGLVFWPLCWIPLVLDAMKQTKHYCQQCNQLVGEVEALKDCCVTEMS